MKLQIPGGLNCCSWVVQEGLLRVPLKVLSGPYMKGWVIWQLEGNKGSLTFTVVCKVYPPFSQYMPTLCPGCPHSTGNLNSHHGSTTWCNMSASPGERRKKWYQERWEFMWYSIKDNVKGRYWNWWQIKCNNMRYAAGIFSLRFLFSAEDSGQMHPLQNPVLAVPGSLLDLIPTNQQN